MGDVKQTTGTTIFDMAKNLDLQTGGKAIKPPSIPTFLNIPVLEYDPAGYLQKPLSSEKMIEEKAVTEAFGTVSTAVGCDNASTTEQLQKVYSQLKEHVAAEALKSGAVIAEKINTLEMLKAENDKYFTGIKLVPMEYMSGPGLKPFSISCERALPEPEPKGNVDFWSLDIWDGYDE